MQIANQPLLRFGFKLLKTILIEMSWEIQHGDDFVEFCLNAKNNYFKVDQVLLEITTVNCKLTH